MTEEILHGNAQGIYRDIINNVASEWVKSEAGKPEQSFFGDAGYPNRSLVRLKPPKGSGERSRLMYSLCRRKEKASAESYFVHKLLFPSDEVDLLGGFGELLQKPFCTEDEFDRIAANQKVDKYTSRLAGASGIVIRPEVLRAVLYGIVGRWRDGSVSVRIGVPSGVDYDGYCGTVINTIFQYLPVGIRAQAGFMTYAAINDALTDVAIYFLPGEGQDGVVRLDEENAASQALLKTELPLVLKAMIDKLTSDSQKDREAYLRSIYEGIEAAEEDIGMLKSRHYEDYLQVLALDTDMNDRASFDNLRDAFRSFDSSAKKVQKMLDRILKKRVDEKILDEHLLKMPKMMNELPDYVMGVEAYATMLRYSEKLSAYVRRKLTAQFNASVAAQGDRLKGLNALRVLLEEMTKSPGYFLNKDTLEQMRGTLEQARQEPLDARIKELVQNAKGEMKKLREETDLATLIGHAEEIENGLMRDVGALGVDYNANKACDEVRVEKAIQIGAWHEDNAKEILKNLPVDLTSDVYSRLKEELDGWISKAPEYKACYQGVLDKLEGHYRASGQALNDELKQHVYDEQDYFLALEALCSCVDRYGIIPQDEQKIYSSALEKKRPKTEAAYQAAWRKYLRENGMGDYARMPIMDSVREALKDEKMRNHIRNDLRTILTDSRYIDVRGADIRSVLEQCATIQKACEERNVAEGRKIELSGRYTHTFDSVQLQNTLWWFLGQETGGAILSDTDMQALMKQLCDMKLAGKQMLNILETLIGSGCDEKVIKSAVAMLVVKDFEQDERYFQMAEELLKESGYPDMYRKVKNGTQYYRGGFLDRLESCIERKWSWQSFLHELVYLLLGVVIFVAVFHATNYVIKNDMKPELPITWPTATEAGPSEVETTESGDYEAI